MAPRINIPPVTRIVLIVLVLQSLLSFAVRFREWTAQSNIVIPYLTLIPQLSLIYPWTFVSTTLVESNIFNLTIACLAVFQCGRYLERAWSSREFGKFLLVVSLLPNTLTFGVMILFFTFTRDETWTLTTVAGTIPLQISFLVAFSQLVPAHTVTVFRGILSLRVPRLPLLYLGLVTALCLTPLLTSASFFLAMFGFLTSWTYLRFYKPVFPDLETSQPASLRGDASETFAFAEFFPAPVKPAVAALSTHVFNVLVAMRLCVPFSPADVSAASRENGGTGSFMARGVPGSARAEAERRRALALKALDQRLHAATASAAARGSQQSGSASPAPVPAVTAPAPAQTPQAPIPSATGPTVQAQPSPGSHTAMTSQPGEGLLGETSYNPDGDSEKGAA